jgi:hypothetical protein
MWARIDNGFAVEFTSEDPSDRFHPDLVWVVVPQALHDWADTAYVADEEDGLRPPSLDTIKAQARARVAARRYQEQGRGVAVGGMRFHTDQEARANLTGAVVLAREVEARNGPGSYAAKWKTLDGFTDLDLPGLVTVGLQAGAFVQACYDREDAIGLLLDAAADWTSVVAVYDAEIDTGWPSSTA